MDTFWNRRRKKKRKKLEKKINDRLIKYRIIRDIWTLFERQEEKDYYKPKRISNLWSDNYIEYEGNGDKNRSLTLVNKMLIKLNLTWGI